MSNDGDNCSRAREERRDQLTCTQVQFYEIVVVPLTLPLATV
ncbi:hypothetical protein PI125_g8540 [Phytophthora idaei]|nr:hypothetical protein PI125_g8540 [Phytophthora idaei]